MELLRDFKNLRKEDVGLAGGKGASLGEMTQAGIPVPPGFVILADSFEKFIRETELVAEIDAILDSVNHQEVHTVENASEKIKALILGAAMPMAIASEVKTAFKKLGAKYVAVRSSATAEDSSSAAWAGQLESYLNTTEKDLLQRVKQCWASLFTPRAIFYRFEKGLHAQKISVAVVVQKMVESEVSGIAFSVHPVTQDRNQLIIEASYGLGEAIVSGQVTPDSYVFQKEPRRIIERTIQNKARGMYRSPDNENEWKNISTDKAKEQALSDARITRLSGLILRIEDHYGFPCDIEWAFEKGRFYIVQSRPITTLTDDFPKEGRSKVSDIDWERSLERKQSFLLASIFLDIYAKDFRQQTGAQFDHQMIIYKDGFALYLRSANEVKNALMGPLIKLAGDREKITGIVAAGMRTPKEARLVVKGLQAFPRKGNLQKIVPLYEKYQEILRYQILAPYWIMGAINILDAKKQARYGRTIGLLEPFRNMSDAKLLEEKFLRPLLDLLSKRTHIKRDLLLYLTKNELAEILNGNLEKNLAQMLHQRSTRPFAYWMDEEDRDRFDFSGRYLGLGSNFQNGTNGVWHGKTAYPGNIVGPAKIIETPADIHKFNEGDVLVSISTNPALTSIFHRAAAIVSDEGGIMSHAAIVSREMKKPCVIGVENASKILKDGDMVEVDADNGTVRRIAGKDESVVDGLIKKYKIHPPFIEKAVPVHFFTVDFAQEIWNAWGDYSGGYYPLYLFTIRENYATVFYLPYGLTILRDHYLAKLERDKDYLSRHYADWERARKKLEKEIDVLDKTLTGKNFKKTLSAYKKFAEAYILEYGLACVPQEAFGFQPELWIDPEIRRYCEKYALDDQETATLLASPVDLSFITEEELGLLRIALLRNTSKYRSALAAHQKKWFWIRNNYLSIEVLPERFFDDRIKDVARRGMGHIKKEIERLESSTRAIVERKEALFKRSKPSKKLSSYVKIVEVFAEMQDVRKGFVLYANHYHKLFLEAVSKEFKLPLADLWFYSYREMMKAIEQNSFLPKALIDERKELMVVGESKDEKVILIGQDALALVGHLEGKKEDKTSEVKEIKGRIAQKGKVSGAVKIVLNIGDIGKMHDGDILVSSMTRPEMIVAMQKAAAFITDEGGITCHAAIVSREMKKPCIIGTKNATKVLKDGDMVEVDAEKGTVRIIK